MTLSLLLSVSCAILVRNVVLRARERRLRAAIAAGLVVPPGLAQQHGIRPTRPLGQRPAFADVWLQDEKPLAPHDWAGFHVST